MLGILTFWCQRPANIRYREGRERKPPENLKNCISTQRLIRAHIRKAPDMYKDDFYVVEYRHAKNCTTPITLVEVEDELIELFGGEYETSEPYEPTTAIRDRFEIIDFVSFVYDMPREKLICKKVRECDLERMRSKLINEPTMFSLV